MSSLSQCRRCRNIFFLEYLARPLLQSQVLICIYPQPCYLLYPSTLSTYESATWTIIAVVMVEDKNIWRQMGRMKEEGESICRLYCVDDNSEWERNTNFKLWRLLIFSLHIMKNIQTEIPHGSIALRLAYTWSIPHLILQIRWRRVTVS